MSIKVDPAINQHAYGLLREQFGRALKKSEKAILRNLSEIDQAMLATATINSGATELLSVDNNSRFELTGGYNATYFNGKTPVEYSRTDCYNRDMDRYFKRHPDLERAHEGMSKQECYDMAVRNGVSEVVLESLFGAMNPNQN